MSTSTDDYDYFDDAPTEDVPAQGFGCFTTLFAVAAGLLSTGYGIVACVLAVASTVGNRGPASLAFVSLKASLWLALRRFAF